MTERGQWTRPSADLPSTLSPEEWEAALAARHQRARTPAPVPSGGTPGIALALTALVAVVAVIGSLRSDSAPVTASTPDTVWCALYVGALTIAGAWARPAALVVLAGAAAVAAGGTAGLVASGAALATAATLALATSLDRSWLQRPARATSAALAASSFLWGTNLRLGWATLLGAAGATLVVLSALVAGTRAVRRTAVALAAVAALGALGTTAAWGLAALDARDDADAGIDRLEAGLDAARDGDTEQAATELRAGADALRAARRTLDSPLSRPARHLPLIGPNARAVDEVAALAERLATVAERTASAADLDSIAAEAGAIDLPALAKVEASLGELDTALRDARARLARLDSPWLAGPLVEQLDEARAELDDAAPSITNAYDAARIAPILLGQGGGTRYLVLFVTPVEARGRTGFPGNWAELIALEGQVRMPRFGRLIELNNGGTPRTERTLTGLEEYQERYGRFLPAQYWQNIGLTPDVPTQAQVAAQLYPQSGGAEIDGVLTVDPAGIAALLELTGPIQVPGVRTPISATNALEFLSREQYLQFANDDRIDVLELVGRATFERLVSMKLPGLRIAADTVGDAVARGHIRFVSFDERVQPVLARNNVDGAMPRVDRDDLTVITNNAGGNKIDLFLTRTLTYDVRWNPATGALDGTLDIALTNLAPTTGLPDSLIGNAIDSLDPSQTPPPRGTNRMWLSVYSAFAPTSVALDGTATTAEFGIELGRNVTSLVVDVPAGATRTLRLRWRGQLTPGTAYGLGLPVQPLVTPDQLTLRVTVDDGAAPATTVTGTATLDRDQRIEVPVP